MKSTNVAVAGKRNTILLPVADLKTTFYVRKHLNDDRVLQFMESYEASAEVPPLKVVRGTMEIKDGRHRKAALEHLNRQHAECELVEPQEQSELIIDAFGMNIGGPLPPTRADIVFVMKQLFEMSVPRTRITESFARFYPPSVVRKYVQQAQTEIGQAKMRKAVNSVAHGQATVQQAAEEAGVELEALQDELKGVKRKRRAAGVPQIKTDLTNRYRGNTMRTATVMRNLLEKYEDGEIDAKKVEEVFGHLDNLLKQGGNSLRDWRKRFEVLKGKTKAKH